MKFLNKKGAYLKFFLLIIVLILLIYSVAITYLYLNKFSQSSNYYKEQEKEIMAKFGSEKLSVRVSNQIDNFAAIEEHSLPAGGGGWCVIKKEEGVWKELFCSQDKVFCSYYAKYNLPKGLIGDCEPD